MATDKSSGDTFLFSSESVGEGHPGTRYLAQSITKNSPAECPSVVPRVVDYNGNKTFAKNGVIHCLVTYIVTF